jgi:hypothetical protein
MLLVSIPSQLIDSVDVYAGFWLAESNIAGSVPFQISIACPDTVHISELTFSSAIISFSDDRPDCHIEHTEAASEMVPSIIDIGTISRDPAASAIKAPLRWASGQRRVFHGSLVGDIEASCQVRSVSWWTCAEISANMARCRPSI